MVGLTDRKAVNKVIGFIFYSAIVLAVGFMGGVMEKHIIDKDALRQAKVANRALKSENAYLSKVQKGKVIEIKDERIDEIDYSKEW